MFKKAITKFLDFREKVNDYLIGLMDKHGLATTTLFIISSVLLLSCIVLWRAGHNHAMNAKALDKQLSEYKVTVAQSLDIINTYEHELAETKLDNDKLKAIEFNTLVEPCIIKGIIQIESAGNPKAINKKEGAIGLMQLRPIVYKKICGMTKEEAFDPKKNVACGSLYFKHLLNRFGGNLEAALHFYNSGSPEENGYADKVVKKICKGKEKCQKLSQIK